jgi:hypothetical protein
MPCRMCVPQSTVRVSSGKWHLCGVTPLAGGDLQSMLFLPASGSCEVHCEKHQQPPRGVTYRDHLSGARRLCASQRKPASTHRWVYGETHRALL